MKIINKHCFGITFPPKALEKESASKDLGFGKYLQRKAIRHQAASISSIKSNNIQLGSMDGIQTANEKRKRTHHDFNRENLRMKSLISTFDALSTAVLPSTPLTSKLAPALQS